MKTKTIKLACRLFAINWQGYLSKLLIASFVVSFLSSCTKVEKSIAIEIENLKRKNLNEIDLELIVKYPEISTNTIAKTLSNQEIDQNYKLKLHLIIKAIGPAAIPALLNFVHINNCEACAEGLGYLAPESNTAIDSLLNSKSEQNILLGLTALQPVQKVHDKLLSDIDKIFLSSNNENIIEACLIIYALQPRYLNNDLSSKVRKMRESNNLSIQQVARSVVLKKNPPARAERR